MSTNILSSLRVPEHNIYEYVNSYAKIYPSMTKLFTFHKPIKVRVAGFESQIKRYKPRSGSNEEPRVILDSLRRTKTRLTDIVISNDFDLFCTFTFAKDRQDINKCKQRMGKWLDHQNQRAGKFEYLIVPEFHKDGKSIHFHALFKDFKGELSDSGHKTKTGQVIYNISSYHHGFSTAVKIDNIDKVGSYIKKYITKDMPQFNNKKRYWVSHNLVRPTKVKNPVIFPYQEAQFTKTYEMSGATLRISDQKVDLIIPQSGKEIVL